MSVTRRDALIAGAAIPAALLPTLAAAQPPATLPRIDKDPLLASCLLIGGRKQIENCSFAMTKLTNDEAKAFAKAEVEEHQTIKANLQKLGFNYPVTAAGAAGAGTSSGTGATPDTGAAPSAAGGRPSAWVVAIGKATLPPEAANQIAIDHEVADQCIANYRREMGQLSGIKLDKRFVGHQLDMHMVLLDQAQTFRRHASPAMAPVLDEGLKVIETHIATLKTMMDKLDQNKSESK